MLFISCVVLMTCYNTLKCQQTHYHNIIIHNYYLKIIAKLNYNIFYLFTKFYAHPSTARQVMGTGVGGGGAGWQRWGPPPTLCMAMTNR